MYDLNTVAKYDPYIIDPLGPLNVGAFGRGVDASWIRRKCQVIRMTNESKDRTRGGWMAKPRASGAQLSR